MLVAGALLALIVTGVALGAARGKLTFVGTKTQGVGGVDGISSPDDVAVSSNGKSVYVAGGGSDALATFKRNPRTGKLRFINAKFDGQGGVDGLEGAENVVVSSDGKSVYVVASGENALATFKRNRRTGKLKFVNAKFGIPHIPDPWGLAISPDARNVYVTEDDSPGAVATFKRNARSGRLKFVNAKLGGVGGVKGIDTSEGITSSPDGKNVYVTGLNSNSIATFRRDRRGKLHFLNAKIDGHGGVHGLAGAYEPIVSGDRKNVYVTGTGTSSDEGSVATFKRNRRTGKLKFVNAKFAGASHPLEQAFDVVVSHDGRNVYVAAYRSATNSALNTFKRNRRSGKLKFVNAKIDDQGGLNGVSGLWRVAISSDDRSLYTADYADSSVGIFKRHR
jgi:6-phosphogluconolactonase (cycloisomerase 2 family)